MKKMIPVTLILLSAVMVTNAQKNSNFFATDKMQQFKRTRSHDTKTNYLGKSRNKKTAAWVFLGGGAICTGIGAIMFPDNYDASPIWNSNTKSTENQATTSEIVMTIGIAAMLTSIPFFVSSSIYKHKANLTVSSQRTGFGVPSNVSKTITCISMTIPIGK